jgi:Bacterial transglutaminase-like cysteine proteinase BTLCP
MTDLDHWGIIEKWSYPDDGYGDCEDYVLLKRRLVIQAGWPRESSIVGVDLKLLFATTEIAPRRLDRRGSGRRNTRESTQPRRRVAPALGLAPGRDVVHLLL